MEISESLRERFHRDDLRRLRNFRPIDDTFMRCLFRDDLPLAQFVLRIIIGKKDLVLTRAETQKDLKRLLGARSLCLDVHGVDSENRQYDIEVQRADNGANPERARYHCAAMDIEALDAGQPFEALPETYTIFITEHDIYAKGAGVYHIERINLDTGAPFGDRAHILYVNGQYRSDDELGRLMHDFLCSDPDDMNYDILAERSRYYKENSKGVSEMCKAMDDLRNEAMEIGRAEGRAEGRMEGREEGRAEGRMEGRAEGRVEGRAEGREEGRAEGREEGRTEGRKEGRTEGRKEGRKEGREEGRAEGRMSALLEIVKNLKKRMGFTDQQVKEALCISDEEWSKIMANV